MFNRCGQNGVFLVALVAFLPLLCSVVKADISPLPPTSSSPRAPDAKQPSAEVTHPLRVRIDSSQKTSRIRIPKALLSSASSPATYGRSWDSRSRSVVAGLALSLVIASGFLMLVFARRRKLSFATLAATTVVVGVLLLVGTAVADLIPPGGRPASNNRTLPPMSPSSPTQIVIEQTSRGSEVTLILGRDAVESLKLKAGEAE